MPSGKKNVLLVDDNKTFVMYMSILMNRMGFEVVPSLSGLDALKLLRVVPPDLVVLDIKMPVLDGIQTLEHIKADEKLSRIPVIMLTADGEKDTEDCCKKLGCAGYLTKPIVIRELHNMLQDCVFSNQGFKRRHFRAQQELKTKVTYGGETHDLVCSNISEGGMFVGKGVPLPMGAELKVTLQTDDGRPIELGGRVVYTKERLSGGVYNASPGMAIEFTGAGKGDAGLLSEYVARLFAGDIIGSHDEIVLDKEGD